MLANRVRPDNQYGANADLEYMKRIFGKRLLGFTAFGGILGFGLYIVYISLGST